MMESGYIFIDNNVFPTLFAISEKEQENGLMHVDYPAPNMTFIYAQPKINKYWMHNTKIPLDILFCNKGEVTQICKGEPYSTSIIGDNKFSDLVVEFPFGTIADSNIKLGHKVGLISPTIQELKKIIAEKYYGIIKY